jgi:hypothetical protein
MHRHNLEEKSSHANILHHSPVTTALTVLVKAAAIKDK